MAVDWTSSLAMQSTLLRSSSNSGPQYTPSEFSPLSDGFSYPDVLDEAYLGEDYSTQQGCSLDDFVVPDFFDRPITSIETTKPMSSSLFTPKLSTATPTWQQQTPFSTSLPELEQSISPQVLPAELSSYSEADAQSPADEVQTPPGFNGTLQSLTDVKSPAMKRNSCELPEAEPASKRPTPKKRGRPRLNKLEADNSSEGTPDPMHKTRVSRRLPHNQVERKYREGLNSEMERLRRAVPTLPQRDSTDLNGPPKPSKATVLASAIEYIKFMEVERERLLEENERLRTMRGQ